jgi:hypothetical protein
LFLNAVSLFLREYHELRVLDNDVLRRIFGPVNEEVTGDWRKLLNEKLHSFYSAPYVIRVIKSGGK